MGIGIAYIDELRDEITDLKARLDKTVEWMKEQIYLHTCELEGISSGMPTPEQWYKSYEKGEKLLETLKPRTKEVKDGM